MGNMHREKSKLYGDVAQTCLIGYTSVVCPYLKRGWESSLDTSLKKLGCVCVKYVYKGMKPKLENSLNVEI